MKYIISSLLLLIYLELSAQSNIKVGEAAPQINISDWIANLPADQSLAGKNIVLEFWATWCGPCIAAVPHINQIQNEINNPNLYFLSMTDEPVAKVEKTLKRVHFKSIVVSDQTKKTHIAYGDGKKGLEKYPLTILIDKKGVIKWIGEPQNLSVSLLNDFLQGIDLPQNSPQEVAKIQQEAQRLDEADEMEFGSFIALIKNKNIPYQLKFEKSQDKAQAVSRLGNQGMFYKGIKFLDLYAILLNISPKSLEIPENIAQQRYNLLFKNATNDEAGIVKLGNDLLDILKLTKRAELRNVAVINCQLIDEKKLEKTEKPKFSAKSEAGSKVIFTAYTLNDLFKELNFYTDKNLIFTTHHEGKYDFIIDTKSVKTLTESLKTYGIEASLVEQAIEFTILENR
jgi:thiol-disulfide isomerase/thioredoxin